MPDISVLESLTQSLALLDAVMSPEWQYRYFSFNPSWDVSLSERMASMRTGSGDEYFLLFSAGAAIMKGFDHESPMSFWTRPQGDVWPGVLDHVPERFAAFLSEPAFNLEDTTFCIWRTASDPAWCHGPVLFPEGDDPDGSEGLLWLLNGNPTAYAKFAHEYFEKDPAVEAIDEVFRHQPLTPELIAALDVDRNFAESLRDALEIGYGLHQNLSQQRPLPCCVAPGAPPVSSPPPAFPVRQSLPSGPRRTGNRRRMGNRR